MPRRSNFKPKNRRRDSNDRAKRRGEYFAFKANRMERSERRVVAIMLLQGEDPPPFKHRHTAIYLGGD